VPEIETEKLARDRRVSWFWVQVKTSIHMYVGCHEQYCTGINLRIPHCLTTPAAILMRRSRASTNWNSSQFQCALSSYLFEYYTVHSGVEGTQDPWQYVPTYYAAQNPHAIINGVMLHTLHSAAPSNQRSIETYSSHLGLKTRVAQDKDLATNRHDVGNRGKEMRWKSWHLSPTRFRKEAASTSFLFGQGQLDSFTASNPKKLNALYASASSAFFLIIITVVHAEVVCSSVSLLVAPSFHHVRFSGASSALAERRMDSSAI
jgi:hypothetical protein